MKQLIIDGLPVKDARKSIVIHITDRDVRNGSLKKPNSCAAALCCKRELGATEAHVHTSRVYLRFNGHWQRYLTSAALRSEIVAFDRGGRFEPGEYRLIKMQPSRREDGNRAKKRGAGKKRRPYHVLTNIRPRAAHAPGAA